MGGVSTESHDAILTATTGRDLTPSGTIDFSQLSNERQELSTTFRVFGLTMKGETISAENATLGHCAFADRFIVQTPTQILVACSQPHEGSKVPRGLLCLDIGKQTGDIDGTKWECKISIPSEEDAFKFTKLLI